MMKAFYTDKGNIGILRSLALLVRKYTIRIELCWVKCIFVLKTMYNIMKWKCIHTQCLYFQHSKFYVFEYRLVEHMNEIYDFVFSVRIISCVYDCSSIHTAHVLYK